MKIELLKNALSSLKRMEKDAAAFTDFHRAGVLIPLFPSKDGISALFTVRTDSVETHKGQISFPGGMVDESDRDIIQTALREAHEEVGIEPASVEVLGILNDHPVPSNFIITPVVGYLKEKPSISTNSIEVAEVFEVPLSFFLDGKSGWTEEREWRGKKHTVWHYQYEEHLIWGATAAIIHNLLSIIQKSDS